MSQSEYEAAYEDGYKAGLYKGRLEILREDVLDLARVMGSRAGDAPKEEADRLAKTVIRAAQRLLWEEAKEKEYFGCSS
jgi:flagellar biosynthesis/type III secretory pathway protein FliH